MDDDIRELQPDWLTAMLQSARERWELSLHDAELSLRRMARLAALLDERAAARREAPGG